MASMGPRVPLIAPQLYQSGPRQQGPAAGGPSPTLAPRTPQLGGKPQVPGLQLGGPRSVGPGASAPSATPRVPAADRPDENAQPAPESGSRAPGTGAAPAGPQGHAAVSTQPMLSRGAGGKLAMEGSLATAYAPPPDSSLPVIMGPAPVSQGDSQGQQDNGERAALQDDPYAADRQREQAGAEGVANAPGSTAAANGTKGRTRDQMGADGLVMHQGIAGQTDDGMPVYEWSDGKFYIETEAGWVPVEGDVGEGFRRTDGGWANGGNPDLDAVDPNAAPPVTPGTVLENFGDIVTGKGQSQDNSDQVGTTTSALTANGAAPGAPAPAPAPGQGQGQGQATTPAQKVARNSGLSEAEAQALIDMGVRPQDITKQGYRDPQGHHHNLHDAGDDSKFYTDWQQRVAEGAANANTPSASSVQSNIDETLRNALANDTPQMDPKALEGRIAAYRQRAAYDESRNLRAAMARASATGMSAEGVAASGNDIAAQYGTQGAAQEADMRYQHEMTNYQAQLANAQRKAVIYAQLLQGQLNEKDRATVLAAASKNSQLAAALQQQLILFNDEVTGPGAGDMFLKGLGTVAGAATGFLPSNW